MPDGEASDDLLDLVRAIATAPDVQSFLNVALPALCSLFDLHRLEVTFRGSLPSALAIVDDGEVLGHALIEGGGPDVESRVTRLLAAGLARLKHETARTADLRTAEAEARLARRSEEQKDRLLASVSHEFRTPLTSIRSFAELLLTSPEEDEETRREFLGTIHEESVRLSRLVNSLLDLGRMRAGSLKWNLEPHPIGPAVHHAVRSVSTLAAEKGVLVEVTGDDCLPPILFDQDRIIQVLVNLLANAIRYSPDGETVEVRIAEVPGGVQVTVRDRGPGIPPDCRQRVFDRYWQMERGRRHGAGLGLSISQEIVAAHGGEIRADEAPGGGCDLVFTIRTPRAGRSSLDRRASAD